MSVIELEEHFHVEGVTPQECFDYIGALEHASDWNSFVKSASSDDPPGMGRVIHAKIQFLIPLPFEVKTTVVAYEEGHEYAVESHFPFTAVLGGRFAKDDDGTRVTYHLTMHPTKFFPVPKMVLKRALRAQFDKDGKLLRDALRRLA